MVNFLMGYLLFTRHAVASLVQIPFCLASPIVTMLKFELPQGYVSPRTGVRDFFRQGQRLHYKVGSFTAILLLGESTIN